MSLNRSSPGCANCRSRRIQCNLLMPRCSQCARASLRCTGYRSKTDVLFRDQTRSTMQRCTQTATDDTKTAGISPALSPSLEDVAKKVFFDYFPLVGSACKRTMELRMKQPSSATTGAVSVGLVTLAAVQRDHRIMQLARRKYNIALRQLAKATLHPWETPIENSIAASYFLSIFEMFSSDGQSSPYSWINHIHGTAAFLHSSFSTGSVYIDPMKEALEICFTKAFACLLSQQPVPRFLTELAGRYEVLTHLSCHEAGLLPAAKLFPILSELVNLYVETKHTFLPHDLIVRSALLSDLTLRDWADSSLRAQESSASHQASTTWFAKIWNYYRLARIIANDLTLERPSLPLDDRVSPQSRQYLESHSIVSRMENEVYACLPSMLYLSVRPPSQINLSADIYFAIIILQALSQITDRGTVIQKLQDATWQEKYVPAKEILIQYLG